MVNPYRYFNGLVYLGLILSIIVKFVIWQVVYIENGELNLIGSDIIAEKLAKAGCRFAFGIPGGEVLALLDSLDRSGIRFILTKHENAGGFMAEGVWHADFRNQPGAPGILLATIGPGVVNAVNVVANAMQDRVPLIFLTGCVDDVDSHTYTHQVFDHQAVLRPIVKASFKASSGAIAQIMDKAVSIACASQPGPVHVDVPISVAESESNETVSAVHSQIPVDCNTLAAESNLEEIRLLLTNSKKPIAIAGLDAVNDTEEDFVSDFCTKLNIPLITTYKGKGLMDESHSLCLGGAGLSPIADDVLLPLIRESDLILLIGYDPIEMRIGWRNIWKDDVPVVEISPVQRSHGMHVANKLLSGNISQNLKSLINNFKPTETWSDGSHIHAKEQLKREFAMERDIFGPAAIFHSLRSLMPKETIATADSGAHRILLSQIWECYRPRTLLQSTALCTMACALPLGIGYKLAAPETPVIVFVGDAGLEMGLGELATLRDLNLPIIICVLVDASLALIELKQRKSQRPSVGVEFEETDFPAVATAMGGHGVWVQDLETLARETKSALRRKQFTLLACRIGKRSYDQKI